MVERCKHCGASLHPKELIIAHKGLLYCDKECAVNALIQEELARLNKAYSITFMYDDILPRMCKTISEEAEEVKGSDIGITAPLCPFMFANTDKHECTSECVAYFKGKCGIAMTFKRRMED